MVSKILPATAASLYRGSADPRQSDPVFFLRRQFTVGGDFHRRQNPPYGVPRPVLNSTIWQPAPPGRWSLRHRYPAHLTSSAPRFQTLAVTQHVNHDTGTRFLVQPSDLSSSVVIPPALFPGVGFRRSAGHGQ